MWSGRFGGADSKNVIPDAVRGFVFLLLHFKGRKIYKMEDFVSYPLLRKYRHLIGQKYSELVSMMSTTCFLSIFEEMRKNIFPLFWPQVATLANRQKKGKIGWDKK